MKKDFNDGSIWEDEIPDGADTTEYRDRVKGHGNSSLEGGRHYNAGNSQDRGYSDVHRDMADNPGVDEEDDLPDPQGYETDARAYEDDYVVNRGQYDPRRQVYRQAEYRQNPYDRRAGVSGQRSGSGESRPRKAVHYDEKGRVISRDEYEDGLIYDESERIRKERKKLEKERKRLAKERKKTAKAEKQYAADARNRDAGRGAYPESGRGAAYGGRYDGQYPDGSSYDRKGRAYDGRSGAPAQNGKGKKRRKKHPVRNFFLILLVILLIVPILWLFVQVKTMQDQGMSDTEIGQSIAEEVKNNIANGGKQGDYTNLAIMGVDSIEGSLDSGNNRSDVMVIASINNKTGAIKLMSVYRDTYLDIGNGDYEKANAAYAFGGPDQTVQMLNTNLDLNITDYGVVGFEGIARLIDAVGGIEIDVQEDEIQHLNNYQLTMSEETGMKNIPVTQPGPQVLNGLQATAYCRIRYTAGNDFKRTERQRTVLTKTFEKIKSNPVRLVTHLNSILPYVRTSLSIPEMFSLGTKALRFNVEGQEGFPNQDMLTVGYIGQQSCVIPVTLSSNVSWLHSELFGETDYQPSQTVQDISAHISSVSGY